MAIMLTSNAILALNNGDIELHPVLQIVDIRQIGNAQTTAEWFQLVLSDGVNLQQAMLATQLNEKVKNNLAVKGSIVQLLEYICYTVQNNKTIVVLNMEVVESKAEIIGDPQLLNAGGEQQEALPDLGPRPGLGGVQQQQPLARVSAPSSVADAANSGNGFRSAGKDLCDSGQGGSGFVGGRGSYGGGGGGGGGSSYGGGGCGYGGGGSTGYGGGGGAGGDDHPCYDCGQPGHFAYFCPTRSGGGEYGGGRSSGGGYGGGCDGGGSTRYGGGGGAGGGGGTCNEFGQPGHFAEDCSTQSGGGYGGGSYGGGYGGGDGGGDGEGYGGGDGEGYGGGDGEGYGGGDGEDYGFYGEGCGEDY